MKEINKEFKIREVELKFELKEKRKIEEWWGKREM